MKAKKSPTSRIYILRILWFPYTVALSSIEDYCLSTFMEETQSHLPHVVIFPSPGMGHLIPLSEFARGLALQNKFNITFMTISMDSSSETQNAILDSLPKTIHQISLPSISSHDIPNHLDAVSKIVHMVSLSLSFLYDFLDRLTAKSRVAALVVDMFGTQVLDVAKQYEIPTYLFFTGSFTLLSLLLYVPTLDSIYKGRYQDLSESIKLPGCVPFHGRDLLDSFQDRTSATYQWHLSNAKKYRQAEAILVNSYVEIESQVLKSLKKNLSDVSIHSVGPVISSGSDNQTECLRWLDNQPSGSVLFISLGSAGTLNLEQIKELACGLEMSEQRFLWNIKIPNGKKSCSDYVSLNYGNNPNEFLPKGFSERTKEIGFVVSSWVPQLQILQHESVGGFLSHSGWNSIMESVVNGVPLIAWPLFAEQRMNAAFLTEGLKVALRPTTAENGIVSMGEISRVIRNLMEGQEGKDVRRKIRECKNSSPWSSSDAFLKIVDKWSKSQS